MPLKTTTQYQSPLRRIGFRRIFALAQLVVYVGLVSSGFYQMQRSAEAQQPRLRPLAYQLDAQPDPHAWSPVPHANIPRAWKLAIALNVPAALAGAAIAAVTIKQGSEAYVLLLSTPFVPLFWYLIGRWLDYELRLLPRPRKSTFRIIGCIVGILIAAFGVFSVVVSFPHGHISSALLMTAFWSCLLLLMSVTAIIRPSTRTV